MSGYVICQRGGLVEREIFHDWKLRQMLTDPAVEARILRHMGDGWAKNLRPVTS